MLELASKKSYVRELGFVAEVEVVGPVTSGTPGSLGLAHIAISLTKSESALAERSDDTEDTRPSEQRRQRNLVARRTAQGALGFTPVISTTIAMKNYIATMLRRQVDHLASKVSVACSSPPAIPTLEEGLLALSGCNVQLLTLLDGSYSTLGCSSGFEGPHTMPLALMNAVPFKEGVRGVEILAERGAEGKVDLQMRCPIVDAEGKATGLADVVVWTENRDGGEFAEASKPGVRAIAEWYTVDFIQRDARSFSLTLPPTEDVEIGDEPLRRLTMEDPKGGAQKVLQFQPSTPDSRTMLWKINPICCPDLQRRKDVWDFFKEDR